MWLKTVVVGALGVALTLASIGAQSVGAPSQQAHHCATEAVEQAEKLLTFHFGPDGRIEIDKSVSVVAPIRNPANRAQFFDVLEVWGHIYKGEYRMHLIYAQIPGECVLMGQEVLEFASL